MRAEDRRVGNVERILQLRRTPILGTAAARDVGLLAEVVRERFFPKGSWLLREGERIGALHSILEGRVHLSRRGTDVGHTGPGGSVGGLGLLARDPQGLGARAETDVLALELEGEVFLELLEDQFPLFVHVLREVCRGLLEVWSREPEAVTAAPPLLLRRPVLEDGAELDFVERIVVLRQAQPFARASVNSLAELSRGLAELDYPAGVALWRAGESARQVMLVVKGDVRCTLPDGRSFPVGGGGPLGAIEAVGDVPRWYDAVTHTPVVALSGDVEGLFDVFEDNFEMALDFLTVMARSWLDSLEWLGARGRGPLRQMLGCQDDA